MDTRPLRMLNAVVKHGSLVAAGKALQLTPSAISHGLRRLETAIGCRLLDRVGKRLLLNQAGEQLLAHTQGPLAALEKAAEGIHQLGQWGQSRLRLGMAASICEFMLPSILREFKKNAPKISIQIETGDTPSMVELIHGNKIDLAVGVTPQKTSGLHARPLFRDELLLAMAPAHPWASARSIPTEEILRQPLILEQRNSLTALLVREHFDVEGRAPLSFMEITSIPAIKELVKLNLGVALLPPWTCEHELKHGRLRMRPLGPRPLSRNWCSISMSGRRLTLHEEAFCRLCRKFISGIRTDRRDLPRS